MDKTLPKSLKAKPQSPYSLPQCPPTSQSSTPSASIAITASTPSPLMRRITGGARSSCSSIS